MRKSIGQNIRKRTRQIALAALAGMMGTAAPTAVWASTPEFARTQEEWERLRDDVLEYEEIADLIREYNVTVQNQQYEYQKFIQDYGKTREDIAKEYRELADNLEADMSGETEPSGPVRLEGERPAGDPKGACNRLGCGRESGFGGGYTGGAGPELYPADQSAEAWQRAGCGK